MAMSAHHLTSQSQNSRLIKLVGPKCTIQCYLGGKATKALWDTGAQVSLVSSSWVSDHMPQAVIHPVSDLLETNTLHVTTANNAKLPYDGFVEAEFQLLTGDHQPLLVPVLVTSDPLTVPIIGSNVLEELAQDPKYSTQSLLAAMENTFPTTGKQNFRALVNLLQRPTPPKLCMVRTGRKSP